MRIEDIQAGMVAVIIKTVKIFLLTYYCDFKLTNRKFKLDKKAIILIIVIGITCGVIKYKVNYLISAIILIITVSALFSRKNLENSILTTMISLSINYALELVAIIISFCMNEIFGINNDYIGMSTIAVLHIFMLYKLFKIRRFKYGISYLQNDKNNEYINLSILNISVVIIFSVIIIFNSNLRIVNFIISTELLVYAIIMFITIKKSLNLYYKQNLLEQELKETKEELENKKEEIKELEAENLGFSKKSHTLIHKQKSLEYKIQQMLTSTEISKEQSAEVIEKLNKIGEEIYKEKEKIELDKTGIAEIDDMLKYMESECNKNKIEFILQLKGNIHNMVNNVVSKEDLEILLADHIKNAIIAIKHTDNINRSIMVRIGDINSIYGISIYDSGIEFEVETLKNLGKKPSTTHAEEGGTGMGFMNTFETLQKYKASLEIEEYSKPNKDNYTKAINIKFDNENNYKIKSYRQNEIDANM